MQRKTYNLKLNLIDIINIKEFTTEEAILYFLNSEMIFFQLLVLKWLFTHNILANIYVTN